MSCNYILAYNTLVQQLHDCAVSYKCVFTAIPLNRYSVFPHRSIPFSYCTLFFFFFVFSLLSFSFLSFDYVFYFNINVIAYIQYSAQHIESVL